MRFLLDTNAIIYIQKGLILDVLPLGHYFASIITEIELLSFPSLEESHRQALIALLSEVILVPVDGGVKNTPFACVGFIAFRSPTRSSRRPRSPSTRNS